jgi:hypothetical protein
MKRYIFILMVLFLLVCSTLLFISKNSFESRYISEKEAREVLQNSISKIFASCSHTEALLLNEKKLSARYLSEKDSLAKLLKKARKPVLKPVEVIQDNDSIQPEDVDAVIEWPDEVDLYSEVSWSITDTGKCWTWKADAFIVEGDLDIQRTSFDYKSKVTDTIFFNRSKILFLRIGKRQYFQKSVPECGIGTIKPVKMFKRRSDNTLF